MNRLRSLYRRARVHRREFSSAPLPPTVYTAEDITSLIEPHSSSVSCALHEQGYYTMKAPLSAIAINNMRQQSIDLRNEGRYEQSWSEAIDANGGEGGGGGG